MAGSIAKAYVQVLPSAQGLRGNLSNVFSSEMPSAGQSAGGLFGSNLLGKIKGLIVGAGLGKILTESIMSGADMQQSLGGVETLFKDSADTVIANAETAYKRASMSANDYMETVTSFSASLLQSVGGNTEEAAAIADMALVDMSDNANKFGSDMESIENAYQGFAKQNYTMLDNLKLGYGGTKSEMERLLKDAEALTGIKYDINHLDDVYSAIHVIQEDLGVTGSTAEEAASTFSGSFASMKAAFSNFLANLALGNDLGESLSALTDTVFVFVSNLLPMVGDILMGLPQVLSSAFNMAIRGLNIVAHNADTIVQQGVELVTSLGTSVVAAIPYLLEAALRLVGALGNAIVSTDWGQVAQDTIGEMRSSLDLAAGEILGTDGNIVQSVLDAISAGLPSILEGGVCIISELASGLLVGLPDFISSAGELLVSFCDLLWGAGPQVWSRGFELIQNLASGLLSNLPAIAKSAVGVIGDLLSTFASHLPEMIKQGYTMMGEWSAGLINAIPDVIAAAIEIIGCILDTLGETDWLALGADIVNGIVNGIISAAGAIWDAMTNLANQALQAAKNALSIHSPSRRFQKEVGRQIPPGVVLGVKDNEDLVDSAMRDLSDLTATSFASNLRLDMKGSTINLGGLGVRNGKAVIVNQEIHSEAKTAADLMEEALYYQERAVLLGV